MTVFPASSRSCSFCSLFCDLLCSAAVHLILQPQLMLISFFWDSHKCRNCFREGIYRLFLFLRWVRFFSKTAKTSFLLDYLNPLSFLVLFQNSQIFFLLCVSIGWVILFWQGTISTAQKSDLFSEQELHDESIYLFSCGGTEGPEIPALLPLPWASSITRIMVPLCTGSIHPLA